MCKKQSVNTISSAQSTSNYVKRARAKYVSQNLSYILGYANPDSPLNKSYWNTYHCNKVLVQKGNKITGTYCKNRWCAVCGRILTAKLINGYGSSFDKMDEKYFVTLTCRTVKADELSGRTDYMLATFRSIVNSYAGRKLGMSGVRKLECTIRPNGMYHPHLHIVVDSKAAADFILASWLKRTEGLSTREAQDIRVADSKSVKELFKYITKVTTKKGDLWEAKRLDTVFCAMRGRRLYQTFGNIRMVSEELEDQDIQAQEIETDEDRNDYWNWSGTDWISSGGELLTGYVPTEKLVEIFSSVNGFYSPKARPPVRVRPRRLPSLPSSIMRSIV